MDGNPTVLWKDGRAVGEENQGPLKTREDLCCGQLAVTGKGGGVQACRLAPCLARPTVGGALGREVPTHTQRKACYSQTSVVCVKKSSQKFYYKTEP